MENWRETRYRVHCYHATPYDLCSFLLSLPNLTFVCGYELTATLGVGLLCAPAGNSNFHILK